jgi:hypothetical protein
VRSGKSWNYFRTNQLEYSIPRQLDALTTTNQASPSANIPTTCSTTNIQLIFIFPAKSGNSNDYPKNEEQIRPMKVEALLPYFEGLYPEISGEGHRNIKSGNRPLVNQ